MDKRNETYEKLRQQIDKMPIGMPATESKVEIKILKHLFSPQEAEIALYLNIIEEPLKKIYKRVQRANISITLYELEEMLDQLSHRGCILSTIKRNKKYYSYAPLVIGMYEFQVERLSKDFYKDCEDYLEEGFGEEFHRQKRPQLRPIPIEQSLTENSKVAIYDDIKKIVKQTEGPFALMNCICKQGKDLLGEHCKYTDIRETCIVFPDQADRFVGFGSARYVTQDDVLKTLKAAEKDGLILQAGSSVMPIAICCCCGDCCGALVTLKRFPRPAELITSNYEAHVNVEVCTGCSLCSKACHMEAIAINNKKAIINYDRCIGCGLCVAACTFNAIKMKKKKKTYKPPSTPALYYTNILYKKLGFLSFSKMLIRLITGRKA